MKYEQINVKLICLPKISIDSQKVDELASIISSSKTPFKLAVKLVKFEDQDTVYQLYPPDTSQITLLAITKKVSNSYNSICQIRPCKSSSANSFSDSLGENWKWLV